MNEAGSIVLLGGNGQVGAEVALRLKASGLRVVAVVRSRRGSAFLRRNGIEVRHGSIDRPKEAAALLEGAALVANFALALGTPAEMRRDNDAIIGNALRLAPAGASHIFFSTQSVYPEARAEYLPARVGDYGREKRRNENFADKLARRLGRSLLIVRLGHVTGELQGISRSIRDLIREGQIDLPDPDRGANVTDVETICRLIRQRWKSAEPGVLGPYDFFDPDCRSWREVIAREAQRMGSPAPKLREMPQASQSRGMLRLVALAARHPWLKNRAMMVLSGLSVSRNQAFRARYAVNRTAQAVALLDRPRTIEAMAYPSVEKRPYPWPAEAPERADQAQRVSVG